MKRILFIFFVFLVFSLAGCNNPTPPSSDQVQRQQQEMLSKQSNMVVGMPAITKFAEKKVFKDILELRDAMPPTFTYITDWQGHLHKICDSVGYGFSGATQFTNPMRITENETIHGYGYSTIPQADPNGLFSPPSDEGTWILCKDPHGDEVKPIRMEPRSIVSPFKLD